MDIAGLRRETVATRVYAVGDVHGRLDLLQRLEDLIRADLAARPAAAPLICYLGDYVDRGPASAGAVEHLAQPRDDGLARAFLKGNHEDRMLAFLGDPDANGPGWMKFGGREALESYGVAAEGEDWPAMRDALAAALPPAHLAFLQALELGLHWRDYLLVHAGLDPTRGLDDQQPRDLMWIREPFLSSERDWGFRVVHGHVVEPEPVLKPNRIGIDTGAYKTGVLTAAALEGNEVRLLRT